MNRRSFLAATPGAAALATTLAAGAPPQSHRKAKVS